MRWQSVRWRGHEQFVISAFDVVVLVVLVRAEQVHHSEQSDEEHTAERLVVLVRGGLRHRFRR